MADQQSNDTLRQMLTGFSAMQYNLGLLPMPQAQAMAGAAAPYQAAPPPPVVPHPAEAALQHLQHNNNMMQQTLQAAQMTRYQPPPSAPTPAIGVMNSFGGGGGGGGFGYGGGGGGGGGGGWYSGGGRSTGPQMPAIFNPMTTRANFMAPNMRQDYMVQHHQAQSMGMVAGAGEFALGLGGSAVGGVLGSAFGPLGALAGSWLGNKVGGLASRAIFNPMTADYRRGHEIEGITAPFMASGANLNMVTGQGFGHTAAREAAYGIRHLQRDHDFERTGFNTQDVMQIMRTSGSQGLLTGTQTPDQLVQKVRDISKTVKVLMKISGDPDVQHAIQALGEMRTMGFQGLAAQAGAVANRISFARGAGMTQAQMTQTMAGGADLAGQYGLVGATGGIAAMAGAQAANVAASSGALNDLQLARAGGRAGLGQLNTAGQLSVINNEQYALAAMGRDARGKMMIDAEAYRRVQDLSFKEVQDRAAAAIRTMDSKGILEWNTRKQEMKDELAQKLHPGETMSMLRKRAKAFQGEFRPGEMDFGTAIEKVSEGSLSADQARAIALQGQSREYLQGEIQQLQMRKREIQDQRRAQREQYRTPSTVERMRQGFGDAIGGLSDSIGGIGSSIAAHFERVHEEDAAAARGEHINRYGRTAVVKDAADQALLHAALMDRAQTARYQGRSSSSLDQGVLGRIGNMAGSAFGLTSESNANKLADVAWESKGGLFGSHAFDVGSFGGTEGALRRVQDVTSLARAADLPSLTGKDMAALGQRVADAAPGKGIKGLALVGAATQNVLATMRSRTPGLFGSDTALAASDVGAGFVKAAMAQGMSMTEAMRAFEQNKEGLMSDVTQAALATGDQRVIAQVAKAQETEAQVGKISFLQTHDEQQHDIDMKYDIAGLGDVSDATRGKLKDIFKANDETVVALAAAMMGEGNPAVLEEFRNRKDLSEEEKAKTLQAAQDLAKRESKDGDVKDALVDMASSSRSLTHLRAKVSSGLKAMGADERSAATDEFLEMLDQTVGPGTGGAKSAEAAVKGLSTSDLKAIERTRGKKYADLLRKAQATQGTPEGDAAMAAVVEQNAARTQETRHGGGSGGELDEVDQQVAGLQDELAALDKETPEGLQTSVQGRSATLFAGAVEDFVEAVKTLKGTSEQDHLNKNDPTTPAGWYANLMGK